MVLSKTKLGIGIFSLLVVGSVTLGCEVANKKPEAPQPAKQAAAKKGETEMKPVEYAFREYLGAQPHTGSMAMNQVHLKARSLQEIEMDQRQSEALVRLQIKIAEARPNKVFGAMPSFSPNDPSLLYIKGRADSFIRDAVSSAGINVEIREGMRYSASDMEARARKVRDALGDMGYPRVEVSWHVNMHGGLDADIGFDTGQAPRSVAYVKKNLPSIDLSEATNVHFEPDYLTPEIRRSVSSGNHDKFFGPMAVVDAGGTGEGARGYGGTVEIEDRCVYLKWEGPDGPQQMQLAWRAGVVRWDEAGRTILLSENGRKARKLRSGDKLTVGGLLDFKETKTLKWLVAPDESCKGPLFLFQAAAPDED